MKLEVIGRREFQTMLHDNPTIATELLGVTADRLHDLEDSPARLERIGERRGRDERQVVRGAVVLSVLAIRRPR